MKILNDEENGLGIPIGEAAALGERVDSARVHLYSAVEARKQTERDAQLLANRIKLLKNEEAKALRNVAVTRTKASQIAAVKRESAARDAERVRIERERQKQVMVIQERNSYLREVARVSRENSLKQVQHSKLKAALDTKDIIRKTVEERIAEERVAKTKSLQRCEQIRQERIDAKRRIESEKLGRLYSFRDDFQTKLADEEKARLRSEALLAKLEKEEMELIKRLQKAQQLQTKVYEDFGTATGFTSLVSSPLPASAKSTTPSLSSSRKSSADRRIAAPTLSSISRHDIGGAALR